MQPGQSWSIKGTWDGDILSGDGGSIETTTGTFVVTNQMDPGLSASFQIQTSPLEYSLGTPINAAPIAVGQPIPFSYTITNTSDQPVTFNLPPADFVVTAEYNTLGTVWESDPGAASQAPTSETLRPGQSLTETATWNGIANEGPLANTNVFEDFGVSFLGAPAGLSTGFLITSPLRATLTGVTGPSDDPDQTMQFSAVEPTPAINP